MVKGADQAGRNDRNSQLLCQAKSALFEVVHVYVARSLALGKNDQAGAAVDRLLSHAPQALKVSGISDVWHRYISKALHEPAVNGNAEMRFQLPAANQLRNGAVQHEGIKQIDVVDHENTGALRVKSRRPVHHYFRAGKITRPSAKDPAPASLLFPVQDQGKAHSEWHQRQGGPPTKEPLEKSAPSAPEPR